MREHLAFYIECCEHSTDAEEYKGSSSRSFCDAARLGSTVPRGVGKLCVGTVSYADQPRDILTAMPPFHHKKFIQLGSGASLEFPVVVSSNGVVYTWTAAILITRTEQAAHSFPHGYALEWVHSPWSHSDSGLNRMDEHMEQRRAQQRAAYKQAVEDSKRRSKTRTQLSR